MDHNAFAPLETEDFCPTFIQGRAWTCVSLMPKPDFFRCSKILLSCLPVNLPHDAGEEGVFPDTLLPASVVCYLAIQSLADYSLVM